MTRLFHLQRECQCVHMRDEMRVMDAQALRGIGVEPEAARHGIQRFFWHA